MPCQRGARRVRLRCPGLAGQEPPGILEGDPHRRLLGERGEQLPCLGNLLGEIVIVVGVDVAADCEAIWVGLDELLPLGEEAFIATLGQWHCPDRSNDSGAQSLDLHCCFVAEP